MSRRSLCLHIQGSPKRMAGAETSSKTLVFTLYESTRRHISEAWNHHQHRFENVKYGMGYYVNFRHCTQIQTYFQKTAALQRRVKPI